MPGQHRGRLRDDSGAGVFALVWGLVAFLLFLFLAVHIAVRLYTTSTVSALGHEAARRAATTDGREPAIDAAERWLAERLGDVEIISTSWLTSEGSIELQLVVRPPSLAVSPAGLAVLNRPIERTFAVRREAPIERVAIP